jgi:hypothetical protein
MKECPHCGKKFSWLARAVGEYKDHMRQCVSSESSSHNYSFSANCRGCPAGCFTDEELAKHEAGQYEE